MKKKSFIFTIKATNFVATSSYILFFRLNILDKSSDHFVIESILSILTGMIYWERKRKKLNLIGYINFTPFTEVEVLET